MSLMPSDDPGSCHNVANQATRGLRSRKKALSGEKAAMRNWLSHSVVHHLAKSWEGSISTTPWTFLPPGGGSPDGCASYWPRRPGPPKNRHRLHRGVPCAFLCLGHSPRYSFLLDLDLAAAMLALSFACACVGIAVAPVFLALIPSSRLLVGRADVAILVAARAFRSRLEPLGATLTAIARIALLARALVRLILVIILTLTGVVSSSLVVVVAMAMPVASVVVATFI